MGNSPRPANLTPDQLLAAETAQWRSAIRAAIHDLRVACPAIVLKFDAVAQTATVQIVMKELVQFPPGPKWVAINPLYDVPIVLPRGGGFALTMPIQPGDEGLLVFTDTAFDLWWLAGNVQPPGQNPPIVQPQHERRRHDITDCFFICGCWNQQRVLQNYRDDCLQLRSEDGTTILEIDPDGSIIVAAATITLNADVEATDLTVLENLHVGSGASGTFTTGTGQTVTVQDGIIIDIT